MNASYEDREAIRALSARYSRAADNGDLDTFAGCFIKDGALELIGLARLEGRDALKAMIDALDFPTLHVTTDSIVHVDGDNATQSCSFILFGRRPSENEVRLLTTANYEDRLTRTQDGWRFVERRAKTINDLGHRISEFSNTFAVTMAKL